MLEPVKCPVSLANNVNNANLISLANSNKLNLTKFKSRKSNVENHTLSNVTSSQSKSLNNLSTINKLMFCPPPIGSRIGTEANWKSCLIEPVKDPIKYKQFIFAEFDESLVIYDAFPKAKIHLLLIPKRRIDKPTDLTLIHLDLLKKLKENAQQVHGWFQRMYGINCYIGVHAIPSCKQLHIHIISDDFNSKFMKHKRQWNSFNTEYLISIDHLIEQINISGNVTIDERYYNNVINQGLQCPKCVYRCKKQGMKCDYNFAFLNELKRHYQHCKQAF
jgi:diadenosine tetraphosphate (Ap4A) HIT family hydrolase